MRTATALLSLLLVAALPCDLSTTNPLANISWTQHEIEHTVAWVIWWRYTGDEEWRTFMHLKGQHDETHVRGSLSD